MRAAKLNGARTTWNATRHSSHRVCRNPLSASLGKHSFKRFKIMFANLFSKNAMSRGLSEECQIMPADHHNELAHLMV